MSAVEGIDIDCIICTEDIHETPACFVDKIERDFTVSCNHGQICQRFVLMAILYDMHYSSTVFKSLCFTNRKWNQWSE
jgi:hypothetical protein